MRADEEAQAIAQPAEEAETTGNASSPTKEVNTAGKPAEKPQDAVTMEDRIEVKLEGKEHPWNWTKTRYGSFNTFTTPGIDMLIDLCTLVPGDGSLPYKRLS